MRRVIEFWGQVGYDPASFLDSLVPATSPIARLTRYRFLAEALMSGYIALVHKDEGTSYGVSFLDVPGCVPAGDTFEAVANAHKPLRQALMKSDGDPLPIPRSFEDLKRIPSFWTISSMPMRSTIVAPQTAGGRCARFPGYAT